MRGKERIKRLWRENWILRRIKKFLPKDQTGRMKGEFSLSSNLMDAVFYEDKDGDIVQHEKRKVRFKG